LTTTTTDTTMETLYGSLMAIFLALFLAALILLVRPRSQSKGNPAPAQVQQVQSKQAYVRTSYRCSACGNEVLPRMKFCGDCGAQLKPEGDPQKAGPN
jgi:DNA-directed RNA polymerase subunit RPC12/RpoP